MHHASLFDRIKLTQIVNPALNASGALTSAEVDMKGFNGCVFLMPVGALDGVLDLKVMSSTTAGGTLTTITGANITQMTAGQDNNMVAIDVYRPTNRFLKVVQTATGASGAIDGVIAMQYDPTGLTPVTQSATVDEIVEKVEN
jgi:hypothetical protein